MASDILELLAEADDGVYAVDAGQSIVFWNRSAERILGHTAEELLGKPCYRVFEGVSEEEFPVCGPDCAGILLARQGRVAPSHKLRTSTREGKPKWISITHVLLPAAKPEMGALVHIFCDATEDVEAKRLVRRLSSLSSRTPQMSTADHDGSGRGLSPREVQVVRLLARGLATRAIARDLVVSPTTVRNHVQRILAKLGAHNRLEAIAAASHRGYLLEDS